VNWEIVEPMGDLFICQTNEVLVVGQTPTLQQSQVQNCSRLGSDGFVMTSSGCMWRIDQVTRKDVVDALVTWVSAPELLSSVHLLQSGGACLLEVLQNGDMFLDAKQICVPGVSSPGTGSGVAGKEASRVKMVSGEAEEGIVKVADMARGRGRAVLHIQLEGARAVSTDTNDNPMHQAFATGTSTVARLDDRVPTGIARKLVYKDPDARNPTTAPVPCKDYLAVGFDNGFVRVYKSSFTTRAAFIDRLGTHDGPVLAIASSEAMSMYAIAYPHTVRLLALQDRGSDGRALQIPHNVRGPVLGIAFVGATKWLVAWTAAFLVLWDSKADAARVMPQQCGIANVVAVLSGPPEVLTDERGERHSMCVFTSRGEKIFMDVK
jgi:hypothetical protein